jgi:hypothetical protein
VIKRKHLGELTDQLDVLGFSTAEDDPDYAAFLRKLVVRRAYTDTLGKVVLTPEQQEERSRMVEEIVNGLIEEGQWK